MSNGIVENMVCSANLMAFHYPNPFSNGFDQVLLEMGDLERLESPGYIKWLKYDDWNFTNGCFNFCMTWEPNKYGFEFGTWDSPGQNQN